MTWTDRFAWNAPKDRLIIARLADGTEVAVSYSPLRQCWIDKDGERVEWQEWRPIDDAK